MLPEDLEKVDDVWREAISAGGTSKAAFHAEVRFALGNSVQLEIRPFSEGTTSGFVGACTDISKQKDVERLHLLAVEQRANDAEEAKRNQELFGELNLSCVPCTIFDAGFV